MYFESVFTNAFIYTSLVDTFSAMKTLTFCIYNLHNRAKKFLQVDISAKKTNIKL